MTQLTWTVVPKAWTDAAFALTQATQDDCEASSSSRDVFADLLTRVNMASREMALGRLRDGSAPQVSSGNIPITTHYRNAMVVLADELRADCQASSASIEQFGSFLDRFDLALMQEAQPEQAGKLAERGVLSALDAALRPAQAKTLVFEFEGDPEDKIERCETPFGVYELQGFPKGYMVSFQWHHTARRLHDRTGLSREGAIEKAQADFNQRVLECLAPTGRPATPEAPAPAANETRKRSARP